LDLLFIARKVHLKNGSRRWFEAWHLNNLMLWAPASVELFSYRVGFGNPTGRIKL
jgi:hypothetical protein